MNKRNANFKFNSGGVGDADEGSKWSLDSFKSWMTTNGHDYDALWSRIGDIAVRTVISIQPMLAHTYKSMVQQDNDGFSCFEILGLDIMIDSKLRPWLIEVNHSPSFTVDTPLDSEIKEALIGDTLKLVRVDGRLIRKAQRAEREMAKARLYSGVKGKAEGAERSADDIAAMRAQVLAVRDFIPFLVFASTTQTHRPSISKSLSRCIRDTWLYFNRTARSTRRRCSPRRSTSASSPAAASRRSTRCTDSSFRRDNQQRTTSHDAHTGIRTS